MSDGAARARHRPWLALLLMLLATLSFVAMQALVKRAREQGVSPAEVMFFRTAPGLPWLWWTLRQRGLGLRVEHPFNVRVRSAFGSLAMATNFTSMARLSLAQFSTLGLSQPVFVALLSPLLLGEPPRAHVFGAMACAAGGAFLLLAPGLGAEVVPWAAALALVSALASAFAHIWVRKATSSEPVERVVFHFAAWVSAGALSVGTISGDFRAIPAALDAPRAALLVLGLAVFGTLGQLLMTRAYTLGEAASVSTVGYAAVFLSMLADYLVWDTLPSEHAVAATLLMLSGGLLLVRGERRRAP